MTASNNAQIVSSLRQNFLFSTLTDVEIGEFAQQIWLENTATGALIVRENERADALYVVVSGGVNVVKSNGQFLAFLGPGGFFGEMALFIEGSARTANCEAVRDTTCIVVRKEVLDTFCSTHPTTGLKIYGVIIRTLAERLQATSSDLAILMGTQVQKQSNVSEMVERARTKLK